jgi:putative protease
MALLTHKNFQSEILSPAGNKEKLHFAVKYGADAVYFGGEEFNLRVRADNFSHEDIIESVEFCKKQNVKTVFLMNAFLHEADLKTANSYIDKIKDIPFDAFMISDPGMLMMLENAKIEGEFHLSTQMNTLNHRAIKFWQRAGFSRIVLGREVTLDEIKTIRDNTDIELEVFVHGALCVSYSGRCLLSRYMSGRDANQGDCSQPCRWRYSLIEEKRPGNHLDFIEHAKGTEILSSKDLMLLPRLEEYIEAGADAFKIEGRMKSLYHAANTTRIYKHAARCSGTDDFKKNMDFWTNELDLINHRPYTDDLFNEFDNMGFDEIPYIKKAQFMAYNLEEKMTGDMISVKTFNPIKIGETLEVIYPIEDSIRDTEVTVTEIYQRDDIKVDMARPNDEYVIRFDKAIEPYGIFRKRITPKGV